MSPRRATGTRPVDIRRLVICEAVLIGLVAANCALSLATLGLVTATEALEWSTIIDTSLLALIPCPGIAGGTLWGLGPAVRATRLNPIAARR